MMMFLLATDCTRGTEAQMNPDHNSKIHSSKYQKPDIRTEASPEILGESLQRLCPRATNKRGPEPCFGWKTKDIDSLTSVDLCLSEGKRMVRLTL